MLTQARKIQTRGLERSHALPEFFLSSCSRSSWSSKQGNRVIIYAVPMQYIGTRRSLMSLIIFIEISIFSRGCYEHATPPYSTESPESRDKCSGVGVASASRYACRVQRPESMGETSSYILCVKFSKERMVYGVGSTSPVTA